VIRYIPISVHDDGVHCGGCSQRSHGDGVSDDWCRAFDEDLQAVFARRHVAAKRCPDCLAQAKEIAPDAELTALRAQVEALRRALHEIAEEWAGSECGVPVYAQEAYAIGLAKRMYQLAVEGLKGQS
jgi:hypothetical protein